MPIQSKAQQRLMFATKAGAKTGVPKKVAEKYIQETPKTDFKSLPAKKKVVLKKKS